MGSGVLVAFLDPEGLKVCYILVEPGERMGSGDPVAFLGPEERQVSGSPEEPEVSLGPVGPKVCYILVELGERMGSVASADHMGYLAADHKRCLEHMGCLAVGHRRFRRSCHHTAA